jgi:hypothetical protein
VDFSQNTDLWCGTDQIFSFRLAASSPQNMHLLSRSHMMSSVYLWDLEKKVQIKGRYFLLKVRLFIPCVSSISATRMAAVSYRKPAFIRSPMRDADYRTQIKETHCILNN